MVSVVAPPAAEWATELAVAAFEEPVAASAVVVVARRFVVVEDSWKVVVGPIRQE